MTDNDDSVEFLTPGEVAKIFRVSTRSVTRWARQGKIRSARTPGGHHRYNKADIEEHLKEASK